MNTDNQDLSECAREPIHIPSAIQPHGFFLAIDAHTHNIIAVSSNISHYVDYSAEEMVDQSLSTFFPILSPWIRSSSNGSIPLPQVFSLSSTQNTDRFIVSAHPSHGTLILEGEPAAPEDLFPDYLAQSVVNEAIRLTAASSIHDLCQLGALSIQRLSGFGRIMAYRFEEDFHGCVIAETKIPLMESYLDHHFPASDIPSQARELYRTNLIRYIADVSYVPVPLITDSTAPIDMSDSTLRSVSPIHLEYLRNMDVASSMSLSIIVEGKLWGLFAAHHPSPTALPYTARRHCEMFIRLFNALLEEKIGNETSQLFFQLKNRHDTLKDAYLNLSGQLSPQNVFQTLGNSWLNALDANGVCLLYDETLTSFGHTPPLEEIKILSDRMDTLHQEDVYMSTSLSDDFPELQLTSPISGAVSLILRHRPRIEIIWFRDEWIRELKWAGNPAKNVDMDANLRITPRKSFEAFVELQKGKALPWMTSHLQILPLFKDFASSIEFYRLNQMMQRQNQLLIQQGKMAMMGEMIGAIAHQWNQPLNALSLLISGLTILIDDEHVDRAELDDIKRTGMEKIRFMSETLDAFRNFFKPDRTIHSFSLTESIREVAEQLLPQLKMNGINLIIDKDPAIIAGYPNEFKQIILNLLSNSLDAFISHKIQNPRVSCTIYHDENHLELLVCDNGGGIELSILHRLFTPYVSTKGDDTARGIGLYLSRLIMEEHFGGSITAMNKEEGACFSLSFPIDKIQARQ